MLHRDLQPERLRRRAAAAQARLDLDAPVDRALVDVALAGALHGAAVSRKALGRALAPLDALLGTHGNVPASASQGLVPYLLYGLRAVNDLVVGPPTCLAVYGGAYVGCSAVGYIQGLRDARRRSTCDEVARMAACAWVVTGLAPLQLLSASLAAGSARTAAALKLGAVTPGALVGAAAGLVGHARLRLALRRDDVGCPEGCADDPDEAAPGVNYGRRGARNDETAALLAPIESVPPAFYFRSADGFGHDVRELAQMAHLRVTLHNPFTNVAFSASDVQVLRHHASGLLTSLGPRGRQDAFSCDLSPHQWSVWGDFIVDVGRALAAPGSEGDAQRARAAAALRTLVAAAHAGGAADVRAFLAFWSDYELTELADVSETEPYAAHVAGQRLLQVACGLRLSAKMLALTFAQELTPPPNLPLAHILRQFLPALEATLACCDDNLAMHYPALAKVAGAWRTSGHARALPPIALRLPTSGDPIA